MRLLHPLPLFAATLTGCAGAAPPVIAPVALATPEVAAHRMKDGVYRRTDDSSTCDYALRFTYRDGQLTSLEMRSSTKYGRMSFTMDDKAYPCGTTVSTFACDATGGRCKQEGSTPLSVEVHPPTALDSVSPNGKQRSRLELLGP